MTQEERRLLAWHETLELHELVAFQATGLMKLKMSINKVTDNELKELYRKGIHDLETNLNELLKFYPQAQGYQSRDNDAREDLGFFAADLLALSKSLVRNLAAAITETATPSLRKVLTRQLTGAIHGHERVFNYMHKHGYYPAYDLGRLLGHDIENANKALKMRY
ncbi:spore coat protein [Neobacillus sp. OS1-32]|jgi:spore coat protein F|uniref:Spore coat protein n=1 Tax=Neobacillus paridis TaxID=2803862 RepID=A0ABS1TYQ7_9BACI|nr:MULTISPECIES: spore coat protein [Neobacillus]MBL4955035.1 spore coat protein [Neobacillus paridis]WML30046.1 spore coat protein [Neobacillus sp. OS1-32]